MIMINFKSNRIFFPLDEVPVAIPYPTGELSWIEWVAGTMYRQLSTPREPNAQLQRSIPQFKRFMGKHFLLLNRQSPPGTAEIHPSCPVG